MLLPDIILIFVPQICKDGREDDVGQDGPQEVHPPPPCQGYLQPYLTTLHSCRTQCNLKIPILIHFIERLIDDRTGIIFIAASGWTTDKYLTG